MLQKFLIVGVGGSGGKTLRILRQQLQTRLSQAEIDFWPKAWQFLHIDVPDVPDGDDPDLPEQLPAGGYLGLAPDGLAYQNLDASILQTAKSALDELADWRPEPTSVHVPPTFGAGQFRAVGRVVALASLSQVATKVRAAIRELDDAVAGQQLDKVTRKLGGDASTQDGDPMVIVISSIAGGAGSGGFLDICDVIRTAEPGREWLDRSLAILYTPDVFSGLPGPARAGVQGNALAAVSEIMAGYWGAATNDPVRNMPRGTPQLTGVASGIGGAMPSRSGPRYPFLVGRSNGEVTFSTQNQVYRVVGRTLAALMTSERVQDGIAAYTFANWSSSCNSVKDVLPLTDSVEKPFSSFGYGSVGLGRDRFMQYAAERLARGAAMKIIAGHRNDRVAKGEQTDEAAVEELTNTYRYRFIEEAGLRELGIDNNDILDAIRGGTGQEARTDALLAFRAAILDDVTRGRTTLQPEQTARDVVARFEERKAAALGQLRDRDREGAQKWVQEVQAKVERTVGEYLGSLGGRVTLELVRQAEQELNAQVVPELRREADELRGRFGATTPQRVKAHLVAFGSEMMPDNPLIAKAIKEVADTLWADAEAELRTLVADLVADLAQNYLAQLRNALTTAVKRLEEEAVDRPERPSKILRWCNDTDAPDGLKPPENELLLEPVSSYPAAFDEQINKVYLAGGAGNAVEMTIREIIVGPENTSFVKRGTAWSPAKGLSSGVGAAAQFTVLCSADDLIQRAYVWLNRANTPLHAYINESLSDYLKVADEHQERRINEFRAAFGQVLRLSKPLVAIDPALGRSVHPPAVTGDVDRPARVISAIPFTSNHPARNAIRDLLLEDGMSADLVEQAFSDGNDQRIEISTFLSHPCEPVVFREGLINPIADFRAVTVDGADAGAFWQWRRTRPLPQFIPTSGRRRLEMIRGWFVARAFELVDITDSAAKPLELVLADGSRAPFPFPLMTAAPIRRSLDVLPAVLETLPVALVDYGKIGDRAMAPYARLAELGAMTTPDAPALSPLSRELSAWVNHGTRPVGSSAFAQSPMGSSKEEQLARVDAVLGFLNLYLDGHADPTAGARSGGYRALMQEQATPQSLDRMGGAWELREDLVLALEQLVAMVDSARQKIAAGGEIGIG